MSHDHFDQIWPNFWPNFGQTWPNFGQNFQKPKSDIYRVQKCLISIFEKFGPMDQILMSAKFQNWSEWAKFFKIWNQAFLDPKYVTFWFLKILTKIWPSLAKIWSKIWSNLVKMVTWNLMAISIARIQNFSLKCCLVKKLCTCLGFRPSRPYNSSLVAFIDIVPSFRSLLPC